MLINTVVKEDEKRVFFEFGGRQPRDGEPREELPFEQEEAEAKIEKLKWERKTGRQLLYFYYDPLAGGTHPIVPAKGQVVKRGLIMSQKTGQAVGFEEGQNLESVQMISRGMWRGEWL